jgi:hypothetical protein
MINFFKKRTGVDEFSKKLINLVVYENEYDREFANQVEAEGLNTDTFRLEHLALRVSSSILVMRHVLSSPLWEQFVECAHAALLEYTATLKMLDQIVHNSDGFQNLDEFIMARCFNYADVIDTAEQGMVSENVGAFFSKMCCGNPSNMTLSRIGDSTYLVRGDLLLQIARRLKFVSHK